MCGLIGGGSGYVDWMIYNNVKIAGTSRGCKANSIGKRASGQERVDRDQLVRVGNGMCMVLCMKIDAFLQTCRGTYI